jgi:protein TonB
MNGVNASPTGRSRQVMSDADAVIFKDLPATFPEKDKYQRPSVIGSVIFHGLLILMVLVIPLLLPQSISQRELLITLVSPIGPPPPPPPPPVELPAVAVTPPKTVEAQVRPVTLETLVAPTTIPREIAKIVDQPIAPPPGVIGGVPGGIPGGTVGGVLGGLLAANSIPTAPPALAPPPPPPPPPPKAVAPVDPVRVGGNVKEPRPIKMVPPVYPQLASKARVNGIVVLEATLTAEGKVEEIKVVSGHPLLVDAAINCVKQWIYEPTYLNGVPVAVILTARVHFMQAPPIS